MKVYGRNVLNEVLSNPKKAKKELNWVAEKNLEDMCKDSWNYIVNRK